jgi:nucleoside-diphosphate-sugar epimerase
MAAINLEAFQGRTVLIFGGSGFLGSHVVEALSGIGAHIVSASRSCEPARINLNSVQRRCDASDQTQVDEIFRDVHPDIVYHLTSDSRGGQDLSLIPHGIQNDILATTNVLTSALHHRVKRVVMTGSFEEPLGTAREAVPNSPYAAAKWAACGYARMFEALYDLPVTILRPMMVYGPGQKDYKVIPYTIRMLLRGEPAQLASGTRMLDWVYIDDVTDAFLRAGIAPLSDSHSIDIGTGKLIELRTLLFLIGDMLGKPDLLAFGAIADRKLEREGAADIREAERKLGWRANTPLELGLQRTIESFSIGMAGPQIRV